MKVGCLEGFLCYLKYKIHRLLFNVIHFKIRANNNIVTILLIIFFYHITFNFRIHNSSLFNFSTSLILCIGLKLIRSLVNYQNFDILMNHFIFITNKLNYHCKRKSKRFLQFPQLLSLHLNLSLKYDDEVKLNHQLKWER